MARNSRPIENKFKKWVFVCLVGLLFVSFCFVFAFFGCGESGLLLVLIFVFVAFFFSFFFLRERT